MAQPLRHMISTSDNPFNPFTEFDEWYEFDEGQGYHTCAFLARIAFTSDELSQTEKDLSIEYAISEIVKENVLGLYIKVPETT